MGWRPGPMNASARTRIATNPTPTVTTSPCTSTARQQCRCPRDIAQPGVLARGTAAETAIASDGGSGDPAEAQLPASATAAVDAASAL